VFTKAPSFELHLTHLRQFLNLRPDNWDSAQIGDSKALSLGEGTVLLGLPGDFTPPSRFVRAAVFANSVLKPDDADAAVALGMTLIAGVTISKGISRGVGGDGKPEYDYNQGTTGYDFARKAVYGRTDENKNYKVVQFDKLTMNEGKNLIIPRGQDSRT
ncbi:linear amide C-N hydrolase, partial [Oceanidesulfovibrio marinus]